MPFLIFLAFLVGGGAALLVAMRLISPSRTAPSTPVVHIATALGSNEGDLWAQRLRSSGVWCKLIARGELGYAPEALAYELWVREEDDAIARELLGL